MLVYQNALNTYTIMKKTSDAVKRQLKEQWEKACNGYITELLRMWELDGYYGSWIAEEVGGVFDYDGSFTIGMDDIIYCVENDVTESQYMEWQEYIIEAHEFGFDKPCLKAWMHKCPRVPKKTFDKLRALKADLNKAIDEEKERVKGT